MVEFRADFLGDKEAVYTAAVRLYLAQGQIATAHGYADRARSRALHDLLALRLDLGIHTRSATDQPLVDELNRLRQARDHHYRRTLHAQEFAAIASSVPVAAASAVTSATTGAQDLSALEEQITALWHTLLIRNADYARDDLQGDLPGTVQMVDGGAIAATLQAHLPAGALLLSYYVTNQDVTIFLFTRDTVMAQPLPTSAAEIQRLTELLRLNFNMAAASNATQLPALLLHAQKILHQLYQQLLAPIQDRLEAAKSLIIAPHGLLHYVPFHALVSHLDLAQPSNSHYLLDQQTIRYLPGAAFLTPVVAQAPAGTTGLGDFVALGHSYGGRLPHAVAEAWHVAILAGGRAFVEERATKVQLQEVVGHGPCAASGDPR